MIIVKKLMSICFYLMLIGLLFVYLIAKELVMSKRRAYV